MQQQGDPEVLKTLTKGRSPLRRWLFRLLPIVIIAAMVGGIMLYRARTQRPDSDRYVTAPAERASIRETVSATGTLSALDTVEVGAEVTGRAMKVLVDFNDQVKAGQVLAEIDTEQLDAKVEQSQAQLRSAQSSYRNSQATARESKLKAERARELHKRGLVSDQDLETLEATLARANASVGSASAQVTVARANVRADQTSRSKALIKSPIDGIVLSRSVEPGQTVTAGFQTPVLFMLARDLTQMQLKVDVDEADIGKVQEGQRATFLVDAYPRKRFNSKVLSLRYLPKPATSVVTYEAVLSVDNSERLLRPGMTATSTIVVEDKQNVLTVPNAALRFTPPREGGAGSRATAAIPLPGFGGPGASLGRGGGMRGGGGPRGGGTPGAGQARGGGADKVFVLREGKLVRVAVEIGVSDGRRSEIVGGELKEGDLVVTEMSETTK
ncbi:MAG: efflux RND transporter periplasmic adaptor subunit [Polyangiaceae bacterium]|nr:efflux RND transporter periplasmic adaptor subunit [Polyangiaceae bacterium]